MARHARFLTHTHPQKLSGKVWPEENFPPRGMFMYPKTQQDTRMKSATLYNDGLFVGHVAHMAQRAWHSGVFERGDLQDQLVPRHSQAAQPTYM